MFSYDIVFEKSNITLASRWDHYRISKSAIHYWETGKRTIYAQSMMDYCEALHADPNELIWDVTHRVGDVA